MTGPARRAGAVLVAALAMLVLVQLAPASLTPAGATEHEEALPVTVEITRVAPQVLRPGEDLSVQVTLRNTGPTEVAQPRVLVGLDRRGFISRTALDGWRSEDPQGDVGSTVAEADLPGPLAPGATTTATVTVPAASVGLRRGEGSWGPRGLAAQVVDAADPARLRLGVARTFALWYPVEEVTATRLTVLVPLVGPAVSAHDDAWVARLDSLTSQGRLAAALDATAEADVSWAVDPWLVDVGGGMHGATGEDDAGQGPEDAAEGPDDAADGPGVGVGETAGPDATTGPGEGSGDTAGAQEEDGVADAPAGPQVSPAARAWVERLLDATTDRDVHVLPYLDADVSALAHAEDTARMGLARQRAQAVVDGTRLPDGSATSIAWPADRLPDLVTAAFASQAGARALVVGPGELPAPSVLTYTPSSRTAVTTSSGEVTVLVPDERLSTALGTGTFLDGDEALEQAPVTPASAAQSLLAELAVVTRERPSDARHLLATVPRDWSPDVEVARAQLAALEAAPWVRPEPVSALVGGEDDDVDRGTLPELDVDTEEVSPGRLATVDAALSTRAELARLVAEPEQLLGDADVERLTPASTAWREDTRARAADVAATVAATDALRSMVRVLPGSTVNLIATSGAMPVRLVNDLDQDATVAVDLRPGDYLRSDGAVTVTVPARGETTLQLPVHAIKSADVDATLELRTTDGTVVNDATVEVRVRADWEGIGTAVLGALLALGVVVGVARTIRRGRTGRRAEPQLEAGPDAMSPEAIDEAAEGAGPHAPPAPAPHPLPAPPGAGDDRTTHEGAGRAGPA